MLALQKSFAHARLFAALPVMAALLMLISIAGCECGADAPQSRGDGENGGGQDGGPDLNDQDEDELISTEGPYTGRTGALVDDIIFIRDENHGLVVEQLHAGSMHLYAFGINNATTFNRIRERENVDYGESYGSYNELTLNPAGPYFENGKLNPFYSRRIREAVNWLIDRDHIVDELIAGMGKPRYTVINQLFPDYARLVTTMRELEAYYDHDIPRAERVISEELEKMGAQRDENGHWIYDGERLEIIVLTRTEDERRQIGDYVVGLFNDLGFQASALLRNSREASRIWISGNPNAGRWHIYTGGWISNRILRDQAENFDFHYTHRGRAEPLWQEYDPYPRLLELAADKGVEDEARLLQRREFASEAEREQLMDTLGNAIGEEWEELGRWLEFDYIAERLGRRDYSSMEERQEMMEYAVRESMRQSMRIWVYDRRSIWPHNKDVGVAIDMAAGVTGSRLWPYTLHFKEQLGGEITFGSPQMLIEPWNPVEGSNWLYDLMIQRSLEDPSVIADPYTGLFWPQRIERAEVLVREDRPITATLDWVTLIEDRPELIDVPEDTWIDWDPEEQRILTVGEVHPEGLQSNAMVRIHYEDGYLDRKWHDGTDISLADLVAWWIYVRERGDNEEGPLFDPAYQPRYQAFKTHYRGMRIVSEEPLVIEVYDERVFLDAEELTAQNVPDVQPWHMMSLGILAEESEELAFSSNKADHEDREWANYISGDSLRILDRMLERAIERQYVPFGDAVRNYIDKDEVKSRYEAIQQWRAERRHFWVGDGPFYIHNVNPRQDQIHIKRFEDHPDPADKWMQFDRPRIPYVEIADRPGVRLGRPAEFEVEVMLGRRPYPEAFITDVRYLLFDRNRELVSQGSVESLGRGRWSVQLSASEVDRLGEGTNRLDVIVISNQVASPEIASLHFPTRDR